MQIAAVTLIFDQVDHDVTRHRRIVHSTDGYTHRVAVAATLAIGHRVAKAIAAAVVVVRGVDIVAVSVDTDAAVAWGAATYTIADPIII